MLLKRLEVVGFKSFAARTVAELPPGIVVVVGPNGSGKSNIADAVRWVLGEQSSRAVRARRPEEVIFAGSAARQPLGMAEVSLVLDNTDGTIPLDFSEVRISRRLYRSGESEYLLNGARVRLKDLTGYLLHARLGPDAYAVVGQGAVDELILQRPEERRVAFESVADIRRHQLKLADTRHKLAATEANLVRVQDVIAELEPHVRRLKVQADRAARARSLASELHAHLVRYYRARRRDARARSAASQRALEAATVDLERAVAAVAAAEEARLGAERGLGELEARTVELRRRVDALRERASATERDLAVVRERSTGLSERRREASAEIERLQRRAAALEGDLQQVEREPADAAGEPSSEEAAAAAWRAKEASLQVLADRARQERQAARQTRDGAERHLLACESALRRGEEALRELDARASSDATRRVDRDARLRVVEESLGELAATNARLRAALAVAEGELQRTSRERADLAGRAEQARGAERAAAARADQLHGALAALSPRTDDRAATVPRDWAEALDGLPVLGMAADLAERFQPVNRLLYSFQARTVVLADEASAREAHRRLSTLLDAGAPAWGVLSVDGLLLGAGGPRAILKGSAVGTDVADWRREVRRLEAERAAAEAARQEAEREVARASAALEEAGAALAARRAARQQLQEQLDQSLRAEKTARAEVERLRAEGEREARQAASGEAARRELAARIDSLRADLEKARAVRNEAIAAVSRAEEQAAAADEELGAARATLAGLEGALARRHAERRSRVDLLERLRRDLADARAALAAVERQRADLEAQVARLAAEEARLAAAREETLAELTPAQASLRAVEEEAAHLLARRRVAESHAADVRAEERAARERREQAALLAQRARDEVERIEREVEEATVGDDDAGVELLGRQLRLDLDLEDAAATDEPAIDLESARRRIAWLRRELRAVGGVGASVLAEYRELSERHAFLAGQSDDLRRAMRELQSATDELEEHMRSRFAAAFEAVNAAFGEAFLTLFGGGEARLVLTEPDDLLRTGIDVLARPPGKKLQALLSLSGGERALTIVALLFGFLKVNPSPFCVLDEVDAALDEVNVQRFADLLARFSGHVQFVVVTHNRATMEKAGAMYGVTMDTAGVSHLFSVRPAEVAAS